MNETLLVVLAIVAGLGLGAFAMFTYKRAIDMKTKKTAELEAERILNRARAESGKIERDSKQRAKDFETRARKNAEGEILKQKQNLKKEEQDLIDRESKLQKEF